jgi:ADP-heptose:LPS heptosyltransferase
MAESAYDCVIPALEEARFHIVDYNLRLLEGLGIPVTTREHVLGVTPQQRDAGRRALAALGMDSRAPVLGVQLGGTPNDAVRHWPAGSYATVAQRARGEGVQVVLIGQTQDREALDEVQAMSREPFPVLLDLDFGTYKGALAALDVFLSHDGGPAHIGAALGVTSLLLYLAAPAWRWAPYGAHVHVIEDLNESPAPGEVWRRLQPLLAQATSPAGQAG